MDSSTTGVGNYEFAWADNSLSEFGGFQRNDRNHNSNRVQDNSSRVQENGNKGQPFKSNRGLREKINKIPPSFSNLRIKGPRVCLWFKGLRQDCREWSSFGDVKYRRNHPGKEHSKCSPIK